MATTLKFHIPHSKMNKYGKHPIYIRIIHNGKKSEGKLNTTPLSKLEVTKWDKQNQQFDSTLKFRNKYLNEVEDDFDELLRVKRRMLPSMCALEIRNELLYKGKNDNTLNELINKYLESEIELNVDIKEGTKKNYRKSINHFNEFLVESNNNNIYIENFTPLLASEFKSFIRKKMMDVSAHSILKNIKPFFNYTVEKEIINVSPFKKVSISYNHSIKDTIETPHFNKIYNLVFTTYKKLELYRDIFLIQSYTGMIYQDLYSFRRDMLFTKDGQTFLKYRRKKTGIQSTQIVTKPLQDILLKYENDPQVEMFDYLIPKKSLDKLNINLKQIGLMAEVPYPLTSYFTRRYFRQSIYEANIRESLIIKTLMGHSRKDDIDGRYLTIKDKMLIEAGGKMNKFYSKTLK
jgi:integrase